MALFNHATKELTAKIVYYGPGLCGKTSNLKILHQRLERGAGKLLSLSTAQDRTIYFDLLPIELGNIKGYTVRFQVCTVPGQVFYNETRKIVLRGVDGLVFVVDSQWSMLSHNLECFQNLRENLHEEKISLETLPVVIQYNKRDLPSALSVEALQDSLGFHSYPYVETVASEGAGVIETFKLVSKLTFVDLLRRLQRGWQPSSAGTPAAAAEEAAPAAAAIPEVAPVLAVAGGADPSDQAGMPPDGPLEQPTEEDPEAWVVPSAEGAFPDLSDDSAPSSTQPAAEIRPSAEEPPAAAQPAPETTVLVPAVLLAALAAPPPAPAAPEPPPVPAIMHAPTARTSSVDEKLNAVLAEARRSAGRVSGTFRRLDAHEVSTQEIPAREAAERRLEEAIAALRAELSGEMAGLRDSLASAHAAAASAESAAAAANDRARRLEDALRQAFRGLAD
ncbi:MAG: GTPase domain-containing protein [Acidobacteriota bacterium]|nr:GTPase domain-containing protein [Acidobacteriota bacterium]